MWSSFLVNNYLYIIALIVIVFAAVYIFIRLKYGFWFYQPVFHYYDLQYYIFPPEIICHNLPDANKYTNFKSIETLSFEKVSEIKMNKFVNFVQLHYLQNKQNQFLPQKTNIVPYFLNVSGKSFFSFYWEDTLLQDIKTNETIKDKKIISVMTSKLLHVVINNGCKDANFDIYYVDYLCVDKAYRKKGIAPEMIQTHHYNQRHLNKEVSASLFKKEGDLTGIVPMCIFSTYGFSMKTWTIPNPLPPQYSLVECNHQNFYLFAEFWKEIQERFQIHIFTKYSNILELVKSGNIFLYFTLKEDEIRSAYFFRKTCVYVEKDNEALSCFASINDLDSDALFIQGYKNALYKIIDKNKGFKCCVIENISHNDVIVKDMMRKIKPFVISPTAYFFYNFAYPTFPSNKAIVIC